jgi:hypothetical protein
MLLKRLGGDFENRAPTPPLLQPMKDQISSLGTTEASPFEPSTVNSSLPQFPTTTPLLSNRGKDHLEVASIVKNRLQLDPQNAAEVARVLEKYVEQERKSYVKLHEGLVAASQRFVQESSVLL